jgi:hypothetical protein
VILVQEVIVYSLIESYVVGCGKLGVIIQREKHIADALARARPSYQNQLFY